MGKIKIIEVILILVIIVLGATGVIFYNKNTDLVSRLALLSYENTQLKAQILKLKEKLNLTENLNESYYKYKLIANYCEKDSDCVLRDNCCNPCYKDYVNIYHKERTPKEKCSGMCILDCPPPSQFTPPVCRDNQCVRSSGVRIF